MRIFRNILVIFLFSSMTAIAAPASESSIRELLTITQAQKMLDGMRPHFEASMNNALRQSLKGKTPNTKQQQAITNMKNKTISVIEEELAWNKLEPLYIRIYKDTFNEEEISGMLAFYKTPAGQAVIKKMPLLTQKTMQEVQKSLSSAMPKLQKIQQEFLAEVKAEDNK